jgi:anti-sigma regulatory factor (Ser/Thr protein kinase)
VRPARLSATGFRHEALLYAGEAEFVLGTVPFIRQGLERREPVFVVEPSAKVAQLRQELGEDAPLVMFADMGEVGANPARIIPAWRDFVDRHGREAASMRGIGEPISSTRPADELVECQRHESLLNVAFAGGRPWTLLCPYDVADLPAELVDEARCSHEYVVERHLELRSPQFRGTAASGATFGAELEPAPADATSIDFAAQDLPQVRWLVAQAGARAGMDGERTAGLVAAANEVATNSVVHGGGSGTMLVWHDVERVIFEVRDRGRMSDPLADRRQPSGTKSASGLWLANQLCDLVQVRTYPTGTVVRLVVRLRRPHHTWSWPEA